MAPMFSKSPNETRFRWGQSCPPGLPVPKYTQIPDIAAIASFSWRRRKFNVSAVTRAPPLFRLLAVKPTGAVQAGGGEEAGTAGSAVGGAAGLSLSD